MKHQVDDQWPCTDIIVDACMTCDDKGCCKNFLVPLTPQERPHFKLHAKYCKDGVGETLAILAKKENNECYYLTSTGCSIWSRRPNACREYSCLEGESLQLSIHLQD